MEKGRKTFKAFRKRFFNLEGLNLKIPPVLLDRLNRLCATGMFGANVEETAQMLIGFGCAEMERQFGPFQDLIDTRGHPKPQMLYSNPNEMDERISAHKDKRAMLAEHDELEAKRKLWETDDAISSDQYGDLVDQVMTLRKELRLPEPQWYTDYMNTEEDEELTEDESEEVAEEPEHAEDPA